MTNITERANGAISTHVQHGEAILKSDLIVPYLALGQGTSEAVQERKVALGDIYRSTSREVLGNPEKQIEIILLHQPRTEWIIEQKGKSRFEYRGRMPRTASNETLPWSYYADEDGNEVPQGTKGASEWRRVKILSAFAVLPQDIDASIEEMKKLDLGELPDPNKALLPVAISFRSTSYNTGKELINFCAQANHFKTPIWRYKIPLFDVVESNDEGTFYVWKVDRTKANAVSKEHLPYVQDWVNQLQSGMDLKVHEETEPVTEGPLGQTNPNAKDVC